MLTQEGSEAGLEAHQERGAPRLSDLVNKGQEFDICWTHPKVLAAFQHVMVAICIKIDEFCVTYDEFCIQMMIQMQTSRGLTLR